MKQLASGVWRLNQFPLPMVNVYLAGDVLIDAGTTWDRFRIPRRLKNRPLSLLALTPRSSRPSGDGPRDLPGPGHPAGLSRRRCRRDGGRREISEAQITNLLLRRIQASWAGPPHPVSRVLEDGDPVGDFTVHHTPGHARGHVVYFRESDRVAICGDVIRNLNYLTGRPGLDQPPDMFTYDPAENRRSIRKLAALKPSVLLPGHGPVVTDMEVFQRWVASLPRD